jgi:hypothetical protein
MGRLYMRALVVILVATMGCGDDAAPTKQASPMPKQPAKVLARSAPVDLSLGAGYEMRRPIRDGNLAIVPIVQTAWHGSQSYMTLATGITTHVVTVREIGRGSNMVVDHVRIKNKSPLPLFVMTGEMIIDGLQDRVIAEDRVIAPGGSVRVEVRCVERGRELGHMGFHTNATLAELSVRQAVIHQTQTEVWQTVDRINQKFSLTPQSKTYREKAALQQNPDAVARRDRLTTLLAGLTDRNKLVGLAEVIDGHVVSIERFATPELYGAMESELLGSYVSSVDDKPHEGRTFLPDDVRALAVKLGSRTTAASFTTVDKP